MGIHDALARIRSERVQINVPIRPPAEPWVEIPDDEAVERAMAIIRHGPVRSGLRGKTLRASRLPKAISGPLHIR